MILGLVFNQKLTLYHETTEIFLSQKVAFLIIFTVPLMFIVLSIFINRVIVEFSKVDNKTRLQKFKDDIGLVYKNTAEETKNDVADLEIDKFSLRFKSNIKESDYQKVLIDEYKPLFIVFLFGICGLY